MSTQREREDREMFGRPCRLVFLFLSPPRALDALYMSRGFGTQWEVLNNKGGAANAFEAPCRRFEDLLQDVTRGASVRSRATGYWLCEINRKLFVVGGLLGGPVPRRWAALARRHRDRRVNMRKSTLRGTTCKPTARRYLAHERRSQHEGQMRLRTPKTLAFPISMLLCKARRHRPGNRLCDAGCMRCRIATSNPEVGSLQDAMPTSNLTPYTVAIDESATEAVRLALSRLRVLYIT
jgi:hypothetical protein